MNTRHLWHRIRTIWKKPIIVIAGSTASGKTSASIYVAQSLQKQGVVCEIISADSRQIYRDIPVFSGAVSEEEMCGFTHHLVGTEAIDAKHSVRWFQKQCARLIDEIHSRGAIPIIAGGSAFWVQSVLFTSDYPQVLPNHDLRKQLENKTIPQLQEILQKLDPARFANIDIDNPRRLVRSIEIATEIGTVPKMKFTPAVQHDIHFIYFDLDKTVLQERITDNVNNRFDQGLIAEAKKVSKQLSKKQFIEMGLAYKYMYDFWNGEITEKELKSKTTTEEIRYAKRQKTFFEKIKNNFTGRVYVIANISQKTPVLGKVVSHIH